MWSNLHRGASMAIIRVEVTSGFRHPVHAGSIRYSFSVRKTSCILHAIADRLLVNIQSDGLVAPHAQDFREANWRSTAH
jgi:hypothetical protein